ncbi:MAG TPA: beta-propeller fold lactonase family protein [Patescibacteria group bacterium]|nr:beta-propeller fold lactonase family protein [Patescibacteria group bacterium]
MRTNRRVILGAITLAGAAIIAVGCCSSTPTSTSTLANFSAVPRYAYAANENSNDISGYTVDNSTGALEELISSPFPGPAGPRDSIVEPLGRFLYVANGGTNGVSGFRIDPTTGMLTPVAGSPFAGGDGPRGITVDCCGRYVYTADRNGNSVTGYAINSGTGGLTPVPGSPFVLGTSEEDNYGPQQLTVSPSGKYLYVSNHLTGNISGFTISASTGTLTLMEGSPFSDQEEEESFTQPFALVVSPSEKFLYVTNHGSSTISVFQIDGMNGTLTPISGSPFDIPPPSECSANPFGLAISPNGQFLFVADNGCDAVSVFSLDANTGVPTEISSSPFFVDAGDCYAGVNEANLDPSGRFLYVANMSCGTLSGFSVNALTGVLTELTSSPVNAGDGPYGVAISRYPQ